MTSDQGGIHEEHPFAPTPEDRDPARRYRGRLVAPVTIVTAGDRDERVGLTISSLVISEGQPPVVYLLVGPTTDLRYAIEETSRFVIHVAEAGHRGLADIFAGVRPAPGGPFLGLETDDSDYGPVIAMLGSRAYCTLLRASEDSYSILVAATMDRIDITNLDDPLTYFRGRYRLLE